MDAHAFDQLGTFAKLYNGDRKMDIKTTQIGMSFREYG